MDEQTRDFSERPFSTRSPTNFDGENGVELPLPILLPAPSPYRWLFAIGALFLPFAAMAMFLIATREWIVVDTLWDYLGGGLSVGTGLLCVWQLPVPRLSRVLILLLYIPVVSFLLVGFSLGFVMQRYNVWL